MLRSWALRVGGCQYYIADLSPSEDADCLYLANVAVWDTTVLLAVMSANSQSMACRYLPVVPRLLNKSCDVVRFFWWLPAPETGGILNEKRQLWHFKIRRQKRWHFKGLP